VIYNIPADDAAADRLERRWFAAFKAASAARAECEALLDQMARIETAWNLARTKLAEIEAMRDALGSELTQGDGLQLIGPVTGEHSGTYAA